MQVQNVAFVLVYFCLALINVSIDILSCYLENLASYSLPLLSLFYLDHLLCWVDCDTSKLPVSSQKDVVKHCNIIYQ